MKTSETRRDVVLGLLAVRSVESTFRSCGRLRSGYLPACLGGLGFPRSMNDVVFRPKNGNQVLWSVVTLDPVDMVDQLVVAEEPPVSVLPDYSVFEDVSLKSSPFESFRVIWSVHQDVIIDDVTSSELGMEVARNGGTVTNGESGGVSGEVSFGDVGPLCQGGLLPTPAFTNPAWNLMRGRYIAFRHGGSSDVMGVPIIISNHSYNSN